MSELCLICDRDLDPVEIQTCALCVSAVRRELVGIGRLFRQLPLMLHPYDSGLAPWSVNSAVEAPLPGGDALVMMGGGSTGIGSADDPPSVGWELGRWAAIWAEVRGERAPAGVGPLVGWLHQRTGWVMMYHPRAGDFAADMHHIRSWLVRVTETSEAPELGAPCFGCGTALQRGWTDRGRDDDYHCPSCCRVYDEVSYRLAVADALHRSRTEVSSPPVRGVE